MSSNRETIAPQSPTPCGVEHLQGIIREQQASIHGLHQLIEKMEG
jgi:hypothetical protein